MSSQVGSQYNNVKVNKKTEKFFGWLKSFIVESMEKVSEDELNCGEFYDEEMAGKIIEKFMSLKKKKQDDGLPKRPQNAWIFFCNEQRESVKKSNPSISPKDITKKLSDQWKTLSDKKKEKYEKKAQEDKKRYEEELESLPDDKKPKKKASSPKKVNGYIVFCHEKRDGLKKKFPDPKELTSKLAKMWKELDDEEKKEYNAKADEQNGVSDDDELTEESLTKKSKDKLLELAEKKNVKVSKKDKKEEIVKRILESESEGEDEENEDEGDETEVEEVEEDEENEDEEKPEKKEENTYTKAELSAMKKDKLVEIAEELEIEVSKKDTKDSLIEKILKSNGAEEEEEEIEEDDE